MSTLTVKHSELEINPGGYRADSAAYIARQTVVNGGLRVTEYADGGRVLTEGRHRLAESVNRQLKWATGTFSRVDADGYEVESGKLIVRLR